jgi:hypothetical protein
VGSGTEIKLSSKEPEPGVWRKGYTLRGRSVKATKRRRVASTHIDLFQDRHRYPLEDELRDTVFRVDWVGVSYMHSAERGGLDVDRIAASWKGEVVMGWCSRNGRA